ncbi:MAG: helix-turn-helix domain-containing protein, partial [Clostridiales bacterium]|nr:helix-turn-helix domain-containing protein [Clostridiales bacterium]
MVSQNLQYLRKRDKITQEELADRLGVSRQAVSKWETGEAYPETEKLILLCDHFGVSIDAFVRSDLAATEDEKTVPLPARRKAANAFICAITLGGVLILLGVAACVAVNGYALCFEGQKSDRIAGMGVSVLLAFVAVAVFLFVFFGIKHDSLSDRCGGKIDCDYVVAEKKKFIKKYAAAIACFVFAILADVL